MENLFPFSFAYSRFEIRNLKLLKGNEENLFQCFVTMSSDETFFEAVTTAAENFFFLHFICECFEKWKIMSKTFQDFP